MLKRASIIALFCLPLANIAAQNRLEQIPSFEACVDLQCDIFSPDSELWNFGMTLRQTPTQRVLIVQTKVKNIEVRSSVDSDPIKSGGMPDTTKDYIWYRLGNDSYQTIRFSAPDFPKFKSSPIIIDIASDTTRVWCYKIIEDSIPIDRSRCFGTSPKNSNDFLKSFSMSTTEVTNAQYCEFLKDSAATPDIVRAQKWLDLDSEFCQILYDKDQGWHCKKPSSEHLPVVEVSWQGAREFCKWLSKRNNGIYRLPKEAEFEFAACNGNNSFVFKESVGNFATGLSGTRLKQVNESGKSKLGFYGLAGNVWEWCEYDSSKMQDKPKRVIRGGAWTFPDSVADVSSRAEVDPNLRSYSIGFRVVAAASE